MSSISPTPTPYRVICRDGCGGSYLTEEAYDKQMNRPNSLWRCPKCGSDASWDDDNFERYLEEPE